MGFRDALQRGRFFYYQMLKKILLFASLSGLLAGCVIPGTGAVPTPSPVGYISTLVAMTGQAALETSQALTPTASPTEILAPTITFTPPPPPATATFTPQPNVPYAQIQFLEPGPMSKIVSPIKFQMMILAGESDIVQIELLGEDGRLLYRIVERISRDLGSLFYSSKIPFEIRAAAETGLIQVSTKDQYGRMQALNSYPVVLLSSGANEITPAGNLIYERCVLFEPRAHDAEVSGGVLTVSGHMWPYNKQYIILDLVLPDGKIAGSRIVNMNGTDPQDFSTTIPYKVRGPLLARLTVRQLDFDFISNMPIYVYSQEILLNP
jgi:hypothetical protein